MKYSANQKVYFVVNSVRRQLEEIESDLESEEAHECLQGALDCLQDMSSEAYQGVENEQRVD